MRKFEARWIYEQDFSTIVEGNSEEEVRQRFLDVDCDRYEIYENNGRIVDGSLEISLVED